MHEERLVELELKFTAQERLLQELSEVMWRQQRELDALKTQLDQLAKRTEAQDPGLVDAAIVERPPHY